MTTYELFSQILHAPLCCASVHYSMLYMLHNSYMQFYYTCTTF